MKNVALIVMLLISGIASSPTSDSKKGGRVYDKDLSDVKHHDDDGKHNPEYDREAFLGKEESKKFNDLTPAESKDKLSKIVDKIDENADAHVTFEELKKWISYISKRYLTKDTDEQWKEYEAEDGKITWANYMKKTFGDELDSQDKESMVKDERRWKTADEDGDGFLSKDELTSFLHPEEFPRMRDVVAQESLHDIDENKDGAIDLEEYISDMWKPTETEKEEPDWVTRERTTFKNIRDKNHDNVLDHEEIKEWVMPNNYDHVDAEAKHLINHADEDKDGILSKEEILNKYDVFVGSQATDFGDALSRHEEL